MRKSNEANRIVKRKNNEARRIVRKKATFTNCKGRTLRGGLRGE